MKTICSLLTLCVSTAPLPAQTFTNLYSFSTPANPDSPMIRAASGVLYGTSPLGGAAGAGMIFKLDPGSAPVAVYSFC